MVIQKIGLISKNKVNLGLAVRHRPLRLLESRDQLGLLQLQTLLGLFGLVGVLGALAQLTHKVPDVVGQLFVLGAQGAQVLVSFLHLGLQSKQANFKKNVNMND